MESRTIRSRDENGCAVVRVEIANQRGTFATMDAADYDNWLATGRDTRFLLNRNGPLTGTHRVIFYDRSVAGNIAGVARQIVKPGPGQVLSYLDNNRLNLRRSNLAVRRGRATGQTPVADECSEPSEGCYPLPSGASRPLPYLGGDPHPRSA